MYINLTSKCLIPLDPWLEYHSHLFLLYLFVQLLYEKFIFEIINNYIDNMRNWMHTNKKKFCISFCILSFKFSFLLARLVCLSVSCSVCQLFCLSVRFCVCICQFLWLYIFVSCSVCLFISLAVEKCIFVCLSVVSSVSWSVCHFCLSFSWSVCKFVYLSVGLYVK